MIEYITTFISVFHGRTKKLYPKKKKSPPHYKESSFCITKSKCIFLNAFAVHSIIKID